jgi:tetratricopeptide (TPR) repeat protein
MHLSGSPSTAPWPTSRRCSSRCATPTRACARSPSRRSGSSGGGPATRRWTGCSRPASTRCRRASLADCDEVIRRNRSHFGALSGYGQIYFQLEQFDRAIDYWKRALAVNPNMQGLEENIRQVEKLREEKRARSI